MIELETLAELLDGRLDATMRRCVVEQLAANDEAYETYVEGAAVISDLERRIGVAAGRLRIELFK